MAKTNIITINGVDVKQFPHDVKPSLKDDLMITDVCTAKNGTMYVVLYDTTTANKYFVDIFSGKYVDFTEDLKNPKAPSGDRDIVKIERFVALPQKDAMSEVFKLAHGNNSIRSMYTLWEAKDPRIVAAEQDFERAQRDLEAARASLVRNQAMFG